MCVHKISRFLDCSPAKDQSPNANNRQDPIAVPTGSVLTQDHEAKREVRDVEGREQKEPGVGSRKDVHGDREVNGNPRKNSPGQTDEMQAAALPKNTSQEEAKNLHPETVKQKSEAAENGEVLATKANTGNLSMVEGKTNQHKDSATATASLEREERRIPSRELKNAIKEET